jgi:hypothetical protein
MQAHQYQLWPLLKGAFSDGDYAAVGMLHNVSCGAGAELSLAPFTSTLLGCKGRGRADEILFLQY